MNQITNKDELMLNFGKPSRISHADGYVSLDENGEATFYYYLKDHLGNVRSVITPDANNKPVVTQANDYFPFGMSFESPIPHLSYKSTTTNKHKYNGKEEQEMPGKWLDYGRRYYDPQIVRFHTLDPLAESFPHQSSFVYADNNPIRFIDFMGMNAQRPEDPPIGNAYLRAAASKNVVEKVQAGQRIGPIASVTLGAQASGKQIKGNVFGLKFNIGYTAGKVEHTTELGSQGLTQTASATALEGAAEIKFFGKVDAEANAKIGEGTVLLADDNVNASFTDASYSGDANVGPLNIDGELSGKVSGLGVTIGAMVNPKNLVMTLENLFSTAATYLNELVKETTNPQNDVPAEYR